jgi:CRISPR-associated protein Csd1
MMGLDESRTSRDYLYGRLLAIAENIESLALFVAKENRDTSAAKLMQRFADHPYTTWRTLELGLRPYMSRLRSKRAGALAVRERILDEVMGQFRTSGTGQSEFLDNSRLSGEFLLGYHSQRSALKPGTGTTTRDPETDGIISEPIGEN